MLRVGQIPYLNSEPFYFGLPASGGPGVELHPLPPRAMGRLAAEGALDAGLFSLVDCARLEGTFEPLGDFCLACGGEVKSVLFFARRPIEELAGATVAVTGETSTSVVLLKVLLAQRYGLRNVRYVDLGLSDAATSVAVSFDPSASLSPPPKADPPSAEEASRLGDRAGRLRMAAGLPPPKGTLSLSHPELVEGSKGEIPDACLLIGDEALRRRHGIDGLPHRYDLAEEWSAWQGLPFVFARWMVRAAADDGEKAALRQALAQRLRANLACLDVIGRVRRDLGMTVSEIRTYLEGFAYELGEEERRGMDTFLRLWRSLARLRREPAHASGG